jgi:hypothetical protein
MAYRRTLLSTNRTVVRLAAAQPVRGAKLTDLGPDLTLSRLESGAPSPAKHDCGQFSPL